MKHKLIRKNKKITNQRMSFKNSRGKYIEPQLYLLTSKSKTIKNPKKIYLVKLK